VQTANVLNLDDVSNLWRVFRPEHLISDLQKRRLTLVRPSKWDDPFENFLERCRFKLPTGERIDVSPVLTRFFGQCWTTAAAETDATWRIYSPDKSGIRVRSSLDHLVQCMWDGSDKFAALKYFVGRVSYVTTAYIDIALKYTPTAIVTGGGGRNLVQTLLIKRIEFEHESEARLLFYDADDQFRAESLWSFAIDPQRLFEEAVFDPRMAENDVAEWTRKLRVAGFAGPISQSSLYRPPSWDITLS
jgi:hypothetical protein